MRIRSIKFFVYKVGFVLKKMDSILVVSVQWEDWSGPQRRRGKIKIQFASAQPI